MLTPSEILTQVKANTSKKEDLSTYVQNIAEEFNNSNNKMSQHLVAEFGVGLALIAGGIVTSCLSATSAGVLPLALYGAGVLTGTALPTISMFQGLTKNAGLSDKTTEINDILDKHGFTGYDKLSELNATQMKEIDRIILDKFNLSNAEVSTDTSTLSNKGGILNKIKGIRSHSVEEPTHKPIGLHV